MASKDVEAVPKDMGLCIWHGLPEGKIGVAGKLLVYVVSFPFSSRMV